MLKRFMTVFGATAVAVAANGQPDAGVVDANAPAFKASKLKAFFMEQFVSSEHVYGRWRKSQATKQDIQQDHVDASSDNVKPEFKFDGEWAVEEVLTSGSAPEGDLGLVLKTAAKHHAISVPFDKVIDPNAQDDLIIQYEVKLQKGLDCGGAYVKLLSKDDTKEQYDPLTFDDKAPYTIMFGPDRCGGTNKVHFIFRFKNPQTGVVSEHHLVNPPMAKINDEETHLYALTIHPQERTFVMTIDGEEVRTGSLLADFEPPVVPAEEIDDPKDTKPTDWIDEETMADETAVKPDDWDEEAPVMIPDEEAIQPEDWLTEEPLTIPDPNQLAPADWDEEEDGTWIAPEIDNPACKQVTGCGPWTRPMKRNPAYKGKWAPPQIPNPAYKGPWSPKRIANPAYFNLDANDSLFTPMWALGFELWTMSADILFDNILVTTDPAVATAFTAETFEVKRQLEASLRAPDETSQEEATLQGRFQSFYETTMKEFYSFITAFRHDPWQTATAKPLMMATLFLLAIFPFIAAFVLISWMTGGPSDDDDVAIQKKTDAVQADDDAADHDDAEQMVTLEKEGLGHADSGLMMEEAETQGNTKEAKLKQRLPREE